MKSRTVLQVALPALLLILVASTALAYSQPHTAGDQSPATVSPASLTWYPSIADPDGGSGLSMALDATGHPHISYCGNLAGTYDYGLKYAYFDGTNWHIEMVDQPISPGWETSLALGENGEPYIAYHRAHEALLYAYYDSTWHTATVDSGADVGEKASLELDSAGRPHIAYSDETNHAIKYAWYTGTTWEIETPVSFVNPTQPNSLDLALDQADHPHLCFYDPAQDTLRYGHYNGSTWQFETVDDDVFYNGQHCSIALDSLGRPRIAFIDLGLWYAYHDGGSWHATEIGDEFGLQHVSLALDGHDRPYIAFPSWDYPEELLRFASFNGLGWDIANVDLAGGTSRYEEVSLAMDSSHRPHIAYRDLDPDDLKYAVTDAAPIVARVYLPLLVRKH